MKILRIAFDWPNPWIGLAPAPFCMTKAQSKLGHEIAVFCGRWPRTGVVEQIEGVKVTAFWRPPIQGLMLVTTAPLMYLYFLVWRLFHKVDIYHIHGHFGLYIYLHKLLFGFVDKTPVVAHFHNCVKARWEKAKEEKKNLKLLSKLVDWPLALLSDKLAIKLAIAYIFVGSETKEDAVKYYKADRTKSFVVDSGVDDEVFVKPSLEEKKKFKYELGFEENDVVILNDGMFVERKNIHLLIESLTLLPENYKLLFVGKSGGDYKAVLEKVISDNNLSKRIVFMSPVSYYALPKYFKTADIYALPSSYENFPKVVLQALASGLPTLASGFKIPEIKGLFELKIISSKEIAVFIQRIADEKPEVDSLFVSQNYSWKKKALEVEEIYKQVVQVH